MALRDALGPVLGLTWREHIGGRWAVSLPGFLLVAPILFVAAFANVQDTVAVNLSAWALSSAGSLVVLGLVWWLASVTVLRHRRRTPVAVWVVVLVGAFSGAVRSGTSTWMAVETGAFDPPGGVMPVLALRLITGAVQGAVGLPGLSFTLSIITRYRSERARLLGQEAALRQRQASEVGASQALRDALAGPVQQRLRELADRLGDDQGSDVPQLASEVRAQAHDLWSEAREPMPEPRVQLRQVLGAGLRQRPLPLAAVWVVWFPVATLSLMDRRTLLGGIAIALVGALLLTGVFQMGGRVATSHPRWGWLVFILGTVGGASVSGIVMWLLAGAPPLSRSIAQILASILWLTCATLIVSVIESAVRRSQEVLDELRGRIEDDELALWEQQRLRAGLTQDVASVLHGVVQGRLVAAQSAHDPAGVARRALHTGIERIDSLGSTSDADVEDVLAEVTAPWSALLEIDIETSGGVVAGGAVRDLRDVVEECLTNAFRHGRATRVSVAAMFVNGGWELRVRSDGEAPVSASAPGMGTSMFDAVSGGQWWRSALPEGGCDVWLRVPTLDVRPPP